jgi:hypothetical protein
MDRAKDRNGFEEKTLMQRNSLRRLVLGMAQFRRLLWVLSALLFLACVGNTQRASADEGSDIRMDDINYLDQYGTWIDVQPYGTVWQPSVSSDWRPFSYGHWAWTDAGWAWVSYEPYGWMVYHYGNWDYQPDIGWFWIVGSEWSPARVEWLNYDGYSSWAPLPPSGREWQDPWHTDGLRFWLVIRSRDLDRDNIGHRRIGRPPFPRDADRKDVAHQPPDVREFEKVSGHTVTPEPVRHDPAPVYMHPRNQAPPQNRPSDPRRGDYQPQETHPVTVQPNNRPADAPPSQFHRMVLPKSEEARVKKYSPQVAKKVMIPKNKNKPLPSNTAKVKATKER